jgi:hypothetical protein
MMLPGKHAVILVYSTSYAIRAEKILYQAGIASKLIPVPRHLSSNCGVCLRVERTDKAAAQKALEAAKMEIEGIRDLE